MPERELDISLARETGRTDPFPGFMLTLTEVRHQSCVGSRHAGDIAVGKCESPRPKGWGEGFLAWDVFAYSTPSPSASPLGAGRWMKSLAGRTFFSPGNGTLNPVASYQSKWLTVLGSRESGV